ncbi:MAG: rod shape-determining protein MreD [Pseudomonadota bacterium]
MVDAARPSRPERGLWLRILGLAVAGLLAITVEAAPLGLGAEAYPSPDLLFCIVAFWALRAPAAVPVLVVFALGLMRDLLTDQPIGLGVLVLVLAAEMLKSRQPVLSRQPLAVTWASVGATALAMAAALWLGVALSLAEPPGLAALALQVLATAAVYPVIALILPLALGRVRRPLGA